MASVIDVAKYALDKLGKIDTWKLQKIVYYCQAWSLVWDEKLLFLEPVEAWANGPVCRALYKIHKGKYEIGPDDDAFKEANTMIFTEDERESMDAVIESCGSEPGHWLRTLTHMEEPWVKARCGLPDGAPCDNDMTHESMRLYYGAL